MYANDILENFMLVCIFTQSRQRTELNDVPIKRRVAVLVALQPHPPHFLLHRETQRRHRVTQRFLVNLKCLFLDNALA